MTDRIKLAEAMGWTNSHQFRWDGPGDGEYRNDPPDPFTDANDDYAVLEWVRKLVADKHGTLPSGKARWSSSDKWWPFYEAITTAEASRHQVGDYARAALKVLELVQTIPAQTEGK